MTKVLGYALYSAYVQQWVFATKHKGEFAWGSERGKAIRFDSVEDANAFIKERGYTSSTSADVKFGLYVVEVY